MPVLISSQMLLKFKWMGSLEDDEGKRSENFRYGGEWWQFVSGIIVY